MPTSERLSVLKTYKLYIDGKFPRTESGRSAIVKSSKGKVLAHVCDASRKDLRDAVEAARKAQPGWAAASAYLRGQILYRMAEMLDARAAEFAGLLSEVGGGGRKSLSPDQEVEIAIDRLVYYAGFADKFSQVLGCNNPVSSPHYNFTVPEASGVIAVSCPDTPAFLGMISLLAPVLAAGNTVVMNASETNPLPAVVLGEVCATGDLPAGVLNILTGKRAEILPHMASHREIDGAHAAGLSEAESRTLRAGVSENIKRVVIRGNVDWADAACESAWWIEPFTEMKTIWHPASA
jgi:hypothetical protein